MDDLDLGILNLFFPNYVEKVIAARKDEERRMFDWLRTHAEPQDWDEDRTRFDKVLYLKASTWRPTLLFDVPPLVGDPGKRLEEIQKHRCVAACPGGRFFYCNHVLPKGHPLTTFQGRKRGRVWFDDDVVSPVLSEVVPGDPRPRVWMGLTPMEVLTQRQGVRLARGRVVVGGLGLGWFLDKVCRKKSVTSVVVVEREKLLVDWLAPRLLSLYPQVGAKTTFVHKDCWDFMEEENAADQRRTKYLFDIWDSYGAYSQRFEQWKCRLGNRLWGWGQGRSDV